MTTEAMFEKVADCLDGLVSKTDWGYKVTYKHQLDFSAIPPGVRHSWLVQVIDADRRKLHEAMIPFIHSRNDSLEAADYSLDIYL